MHWLAHWLAHWLGLDNPSGPVYLFWSGWFGDVSFVVWPIVFLHHRNCHTPRCWRLQHHPLDVCRRCHRMKPPTS